MNRICILLVTLLMAWSCKKDDGGDGVTVIPPEALSDIIVEDDADIKEYLETHFYNYEAFETPSVDFDYKIKIDTISRDNGDKIPLWNQVESKTVAVSSERFSGLDDEEVQHTFYYLEARVGEGAQPSVADSVYVRYRGSLLDGSVFDGADETPIWFNLATIQGTGARGFTEGASMFKSGGEVIDNGDGTFSVENYGVGLVIFPSGLGYFNSSQTSIPAYSPLIFEMDMFAINVADHDFDGIPSIQEDINGNAYMFDDEDDTDEDGFPNYLDSDDDGDGTSTLDEISDDEGNIIIPYPDTDNDSIPDYLDPDNS